MKLAYAIVICVLLASAPVALADGGNEPPSDPRQAWPHCWVFYYSLDPPGYVLDPDCITPLPLP